MYKLKGFVTINSFVTNNQNNISPIGEISKQALTYSKSTGLYTGTASNSDLSIYSFMSRTSMDNVNIPNNIRDQVFEITNWITSNQTSVNAPITKSVFLSQLTTQFNNSITSINAGSMIQTSGNVYFPEWISFTKTGLPNTDVAKDNEIRIWYSDQSFKDQYDEYEIVVVPPLAAVDTFFSNYSALTLAIQNTSPSEVMINVQAAKNGFPESIMSVETFEYVNPSDSTIKLKTNWTVLHYGIAGNTSSIIKDSIRNYITANTHRTESEWKAIFPELFKTTEFIILPRWNNFSVQELVVQGGIYSSVTKLNKEINYVKNLFPTVSVNHITSHLAVLPVNYKSLNLLVLSGEQNDANMLDIEAVYPDLMNVPTTDVLFDSMDVATKTWLLKIISLLVLAERVGVYDTVPAGVRKTLRNNILYVSFTLNNVEYLIATKQTLPNY